MERSYIAFISYKHTERDAAIAKQVHTLIENYIIPKSLRKGSKRLGVVFRDEEELPISSDLTESIRTALDETRYLIVVCSREAKESPWVAREVSYFLENHDPKDAFVILADGEPDEVFPYALTHVLDKETGEYQDVEPLALDVRADSTAASVKKVREHIKKLYAGMLGCSYDSLVQREKMRKLKRFAALGALAVLLVGSFIGMLFIKNRELSQKNDELTAAIELALNRETELLTQQADEALESGDMAAAIRYASDALYSETIERPYYAAAERALFSAADVLQEEVDKPLLSKIALKHHSPVEMMTYSADGRTIYTIDSYGMVACFETASGDLLWEEKLREHTRERRLAVDPQIWYDAEKAIVACYYDDVLSGLDAETGALAWQNEFESTVANGFFFDEKDAKLAYIERVYVPDPEDYYKSYYEYNFIVRSVWDGGIIQKIPFEVLTRNEMESMSPVFGKYDDCHSTGMLAGSDDFVGTVIIPEIDASEAFFYSVDLAEGTALFVKNESLTKDTDYLCTLYAGDNRALVVSNSGSMNYETVTFENDLRLQCYDMKTGGILWEKLVEEDNASFAGASGFILPREIGMVLAIGDRMYVIDNETGEIKASTSLYDQIMEMHPVADGLFGFTLANGYYAVGWSNKSGLSDSDFFSAVVELPETPGLIHYNEGLLQVHFAEKNADGSNTISGFSFLSEKEGGSLTYLSPDRCTAYVTTALPEMQLPEPIPVEAVGAAAIGLGELLDATPGGKVLLGPSSLEDGYGMTILDTQSHTLETFAMEDALSLTSSSFNALYLTSDGQNIIKCARDGEIKSIALDGSISVIGEPENVVLQTLGNVDYLASIHKSDATRLASDGRVIAARVDRKKKVITYWLDGGEETSVPLPEDICGALQNGINILSMFRVGENGLMVVSDYEADFSGEFENFAVYNLASKQWKLIPDAGCGTEERPVAFAQNAPVFAVYDEDMNVRFYDWNSGELVHCLNTKLPVVSVWKIGMLLDDAYMYVLTEDGRFMIYCIESGEMVFRTVFANLLSASDFSEWLDSENGRLYLRTDSQGLGVDMKTWEQLFTAKDFKYYSPEQNEVYIYSFDGLAASRTMKAIPIPSTQELVNMARDIFS